jgi:hypothetical protein
VAGEMLNLPKGLEAIVIDFCHGCGRVCDASRRGAVICEWALSWRLGMGL